MSDARAEMVRLIAENREGFQAEECEAIFIVQVEDLINGGVDPCRVFASMARGWIRMQMAIRGRVATAELLRDFADLTERPALEKHSSTKKSGARH